MRTRRSLVSVIAVALSAPALVVASAGPAAAATADPERYATTPTGWAWYFSASVPTISDYLADNGMRLIDLEITGTNPMAFSVSMVHNSGPYARTWWWYYDQTVSSLLDKLENRRLIDLERYVVNGQTRFAAIMVDNSGSKFHDYKWYVNSTPSYIKTKLDDFGGRIIDIDPATPGRYDVVMIKNTGVDAKSWWYYYRVTPTHLATLLGDNQARLVDIEPDTTGRYTVVMVKSQGEYWWWHNELTSSAVTELQAQTGMRIIDIERYKNGSGFTRYAVLLLNNLDQVATNVRQILWEAADWDDGDRPAFGFYLKKVGGPVVYGLQHERVFEPASMLKALHHITAMLAVKGGSADVTEDVTWYRRPDIRGTEIDESNAGGICAYQDDGDPITSMPEVDDLSVVLSGMMKQSDNRMTDAIYNRFGPNAINATADLLGMDDTQLNHRIGCTWEAAGQVAAPNELTLVDDGKLFEAVGRARSPILTGTVANQFYSYMGTGLGTLKDVATEEAASLGKSPAVLSAFKNAMKGAFKPGGYGNGTGTCDQSGCTAAILRSTGGGWVALPFKVNGSIVVKGYVYGAFFDGVFDCGPGSSTDCKAEGDLLPTARAEAYAEMLRPQIRAALMTW